MEMIWDELGIAKEVWDRLPAPERLARYRTMHPAPLKCAPREPTAAQQVELDAISNPGQKLTRFREMQAAQGKH